jgi:glucose-6-phosphate dehydrogenase assembly protein OpcA
MSEAPTPAPLPVVQAPGIKYLVPLRDVERELSNQMKALQGAGAAPVQRARMSNLVIFCNSLEQSILLNEQVPAISMVHPARVLLLVGDSDMPDRELTSRVTVRPLGEGSKRYACAEQVTLHAGGAFVDRLPFAVRALLIGDLPVNLLWAAPTPPPLAGALLYELAENAQQIIYDSLGWRDPARGVSATGTWLDQVERSTGFTPGQGTGSGGRWRVASDLNWRRLKYWRRLLAQSLEPASAPGAAESVSEVRIEHGPHAVIQGWLLASWLSRRLDWRVQAGKLTPGVEMSWAFVTPRGRARVALSRLEEGPAAIRRVRIVCQIEGKPGAMNLTAEESGRLSLQLEGTSTAARTIALPAHSAIDLIGRQLSDRERDPVFRESMAVAQVMAQSVLQ